MDAYAHIRISEFLLVNQQDGFLQIYITSAASHDHRYSATTVAVFVRASTGTAYTGFLRLGSILLG